LASRFSEASAYLGSWAPKGLYARALIIIIAPIVILQSILTFVFLDRHWQVVTRRLSTATAQDIAMLASTYELMKNKSPGELDRGHSSDSSIVTSLTRFAIGFTNHSGSTRSDSRTSSKSESSSMAP
jgi:hypothetical protein